jgi:hypothetical protein
MLLGTDWGRAVLKRSVSYPPPRLTGWKHDGMEHELIEIVNTNLSALTAGNC